MNNLYGEFTKDQISSTKKSLRGSIFFLLLCVDAKTSDEYKNVNVQKCFEGLLLKIGGMNELLMNQPEIVTTMSLLQAALMEYRKKEEVETGFNFGIYRKLILDAGAEIDKLREED